MRSIAHRDFPSLLLPRLQTVAEGFHCQRERLVGLATGDLQFFFEYLKILDKREVDRYSISV